MEYIGEVIPQTEFIRRTREYDTEGYTHYYFMTLKNDEVKNREMCTYLYVWYSYFTYNRNRSLMLQEEAV
jgi:hypothetical protein